MKSGYNFWVYGCGKWNSNRARSVNMIPTDVKVVIVCAEVKSSFYCCMHDAICGCTYTHIQQHLCRWIKHWCWKFLLMVSLRDWCWKYVYLIPVMVMMFVCVCVHLELTRMRDKFPESSLFHFNDHAIGVIIPITEWWFFIFGLIGNLLHSNTFWCFNFV